MEEHGVELSEELAEQLSPPRDSMSDPARLGALRRIAKAARRQGLFQLSAKVYAQVRSVCFACLYVLRLGG